MTIWNYGLGVLGSARLFRNNYGCNFRYKNSYLSYRHIRHMQVPSIIGCKDHGDARLAVNEINKIQFFLKNIMMKNIHSHSQVQAGHKYMQAWWCWSLDSISGIPLNCLKRELSLNIIIITTIIIIIIHFLQDWITGLGVELPMWAQVG